MAAPTVGVKKLIKGTTEAEVIMVPMVEAWIDLVASFVLSSIDVPAIDMSRPVCANVVKFIEKCSMQ